MNWLSQILHKKRCKAHNLEDCPTCTNLPSDRIIRDIENKTRDLKPVKKKKDDTKNSS